MTKTLVNLDPSDKAWLDREAKRRRLPMTELVRQAVQVFRSREDRASQPTLSEALARTSGIWQHGDGLAYQQRLRSEWDRGE